MYKSIKSCVSVNGEFSASFISEIGVRQGENLSAALFPIHLNDLQSYLQDNGIVGEELHNPHDFTLWLKLLVLFFADETVLLSSTFFNTY